MAATAAAPAADGGAGVPFLGEEPPWSVDDLAGPLIQKYEARIRELERGQSRQVELFEGLSREVETLTAVRPRRALAGGKGGGGVLTTRTHMLLM
jgi:hypothetical protein